MTEIYNFTTESYLGQGGEGVVHKYEKILNPDEVEEVALKRIPIHNNEHFEKNLKLSVD